MSIYINHFFATRCLVKKGRKEQTWWKEVGPQLLLLATRGRQLHLQVTQGHQLHIQVTQGHHVLLQVTQGPHLHVIFIF